MEKIFLNRILYATTRFQALLDVILGIIALVLSLLGYIYFKIAKRSIGLVWTLCQPPSAPNNDRLFSSDSLSASDSMSLEVDEREDVKPNLDAQFAPAFRYLFMMSIQNVFVLLYAVILLNALNKMKFGRHRLFWNTAILVQTLLPININIVLSLEIFQDLRNDNENDNNLLNYLPKPFDPSFIIPLAIYRIIFFINFNKIFNQLRVEIGSLCKNHIFTRIQLVPTLPTDHLQGQGHRLFGSETGVILNIPELEKENAGTFCYFNKMKGETKTLYDVKII